MLSNKNSLGTPLKYLIAIVRHLNKVGWLLSRVNSIYLSLENPSMHKNMFIVKALSFLSFNVNYSFQST